MVKKQRLGRWFGVAGDELNDLLEASESESKMAEAKLKWLGRGGKQKTTTRSRRDSLRWARNSAHA